jgi:cold shock CspA family protein
MSETNEKPRQRGRVVRVFPDFGFFFIGPDNGGDDIFGHISSVCNRIEPAVGDAVTFELGARFDGRPKAIRVEISESDA